MLWGSRGTTQAQASLRREIANLRGVLGQVSGGTELVAADNRAVRLDLARVTIDLQMIELELSFGGICERGQEHRPGLAGGVVPAPRDARPA